MTRYRELKELARRADLARDEERETSGNTGKRAPEA